MQANRKAARRERRVFSAEFKAEAVRLMRERRSSGTSVALVARELDVRPEQLRVWARELDGATVPSSIPGETLEQENRRLRRENAVLRQEQAFEKRVAVYFAKESR